MVYRRTEHDERFDGDAGIVGELANQFADPFAFMRELVQNAIDAKSTSIHVAIRHEGSEFVVSVRDDGCGMSADTLQNELLVLFVSSKEGDPTAIGKFGVGFASVFAIGPSSVQVQTSRGDGPVWTLSLGADMQYEIHQAGGGSTSGTSVILRIPVAVRNDGFVDAALESLRRWCRHVSVPLHVSVTNGDTSETIQINEPFVLEDAIVQVDVSEGDVRMVVGLSETPYAGFFNRGLTLLEDTTADTDLHKLCFKVDDPSLGHTISRDDVVRDAAFADVLMRVKQAARAHLGRALVAKVAELAKAPAVASPRSTLDTPLYFDEIEASETDPYVRACSLLLYYRSALTIPLSSIVLRQLEVAAPRPALREHAVVAPASCPRTQALYRAGCDVLHAEGRFASLLQSHFDAQPIDTYSMITLHTEDEVDAQVLKIARRVLKDTSRAPTLQWVECFPHDCLNDGMGCGTTLERTRMVLDCTAGDPFAWISPATVWLNANDALFKDARRLAAYDPEMAGALIARAVVGHFKGFETKTGRKWLEAAHSVVK